MGQQIPDLPEQDLDPMMRRETLELVRAYYRIPAAGPRRRLADLVKTLSKVAV